VRRGKVWRGCALGSIANERVGRISSPVWRIMSAVIVGEPPRTTWMAVWRVAVWVQVPVDAEYDQ
jgi:hypothetical protein